MDLWNSVNGMVLVEMTSADPEAALRELSDQGMELYQISSISDMTVQFLIQRSSLNSLRKQCEKRGNTLELRKKAGIYWLARGLTGRPVLLLGCLLFLLLVMYLPTRILFVQVEGNAAVPAKLILEAADTAGIHFGASRREVRSEKMKNALLSAIPQLQWAGVNTYGCTAVISVRERSTAQADMEEPGVTSIVAVTDGMVYSCTATNGTLLCREGDMVKQGQVLISGYTDCGLCIQAGRAEGEIYAQTNRYFMAVIPAEYAEIRIVSRINRKFSLLVGKKRINLWKDSGNWDSSCGRMYKEYYITLPGGFLLPFGAAIDTEYGYETVTSVLPEAEAQELLSEAARRDVIGGMVAGTIRQESAFVFPENTVYRFSGSYVCTEMIGRVKREQIGEIYG